MRAIYPIENGQKPALTTGGNLPDMMLWGFWVLATLQSPTSSSAPVALGLAVVAAALLVVLAAAGPRMPARTVPTGVRPAGNRTHRRRVPRLIDPDAAGRPRPRAPSAYPAAA
jgi:hypothetical protein